MTDIRNAGISAYGIFEKIEALPPLQRNAGAESITGAWVSGDAYFLSATRTADGLVRVSTGLERERPTAFLELRLPPEAVPGFGTLARGEPLRVEGKVKGISGRWISLETAEITRLRETPAAGAETKRALRDGSPAVAPSAEIPREALRFRASLLRKLVFFLCITPVGIGASSLLIHRPPSDLLLSWIGITLGFLISTIISDRLARSASSRRPDEIVITSEAVIGPGKWGRATTIRFSEIDHSATNARSPWRWLGGNRVIYGANRSRVVLSVLLLGRAKVDRILELAGCSDVSAA